ncbi:hypothetical protein [Bacillus xiapuensis]|uniref:Uncharacterized protein n=1 Tax=Bacillus xiapuensis TaxID=2014075 RepID=A0ABU6N6A2_9BACI|nr:hypothetical protein [Bacillus xiapuensis]
MKKMFLGLLILCVLSFSSVTNAFAHPGRTDRLGGHFKRANCTYMFHHPTSAVSGKSKATIVSLIKRYNSNDKCTRSLTINKVNWSTVRHK